MTRLGRQLAITMYHRYLDSYRHDQPQSALDWLCSPDGPCNGPVPPIDCNLCNSGSLASDDEDNLNVAADEDMDDDGNADVDVSAGAGTADDTDVSDTLDDSSDPISPSSDAALHGPSSPYPSPHPYPPQKVANLGDAKKVAIIQM